MTLADLLTDPGVEMAAVAAHLRPLGAAGRVAEVVALAPAAQRRLWRLAWEAPGTGELVPDAAAATTTVFAGRNSLAFLNRFEKRFTWQGGTLVGHNHHPLRRLIGPGYFTVEPGAEGRLRFDYAKIPERSPAGWPAVRTNSAFPMRLVYGDLADDVAWVTGDVLVGSASRGGRDINSFFVLARRPT